MSRWYEDVPLNEPFALGEHTFTKQEIERFASLYDPQYFHVDAEAAKQSHFGTQIASGWHTVCVGHRKTVDTLFAEERRLRSEGQEPGQAGPSPGVNKMEFKAPVKPGDTVTYTLYVTHKRPSNKLPGWGILINDLHAHNQHNELVYRAEIVSFSKRRDFKPTPLQTIKVFLSKTPLYRLFLRLK